MTEQTDLFAGAAQQLQPDLYLLSGLALNDANDLMVALQRVSSAAAFRQMQTPGGLAMSAAITNCGHLGWCTDRQGYRYSSTDPLTGRAWPDMPDCFYRLACHAASLSGYADFQPDVCLINRYAVGSKMGLHQDRDEQDFSQPIVSVSLGLPAVFQFGGSKRSDPKLAIPLKHGDVVVWGGAQRLSYHGILKVAAGTHPLTGDYRYNLTFRRAG